MVILLEKVLLSKYSHTSSWHFCLHIGNDIQERNLLTKEIYYPNNFVSMARSMCMKVFFKACFLYYLRSPTTHEMQCLTGLVKNFLIVYL